MNYYNGFSPTTRNRAQRWLNTALLDGRIVRRTVCDLCGQTRGQIDAHAEDYSEPFGPHIAEFWLCYRCHMMLHCRHRSPEAWTLYLGHVRTGIFPPCFGRDFGAIKTMLMSSWPPKQLAAPEGRYDRLKLIPRLFDPLAE
jgi:hypothetical protein